MCVATLYGVSGASGDNAKKDETERLLACALLRMASMRNVPYMLNMDLNIDPKKMEVLTKCIEKGICHDIVNDIHQGDPPPTYCKTNVHLGMTGVGTSRIDTIVTNPAAANLVKSVEQLYTTAQAFDHTPFKCIFNADKFADEYSIMDKPCR